jgi:hypothetical protein
MTNDEWPISVCCTIRHPSFVIFNYEPANQEWRNRHGRHAMCLTSCAKTKPSRALTAASSRPREREVIDAKGKFVFPGFIDPHVHIYLPFMGTFSKDDYVTGSRAALVGGTTTLIEMCCPARKDDALERL